MLQISIIHLHLLPVACLVATAKADGWDDFANNLATDLAPLLALFGEQATKQFLSESTTMWDNFIFAMAPLGILTAVVSAIRVCGGPSLRAFIGRAQEGGGIAEAELCSSTSRDVCELYHNGAIVRVFGSPKILEIVHDRKAALPNDGDSKTPPECGIYSFQEYIKTPSAKEAGWEELREARWKQLVKVVWKERREAGWKGLVKTGWKELWKHPQPDPVDLEPANPRTKPASNDIDGEFAPNPNLSFNIGIQEPPSCFVWLAATAGFLLQASVVVFGFLVTYTWRWTKEERLPQVWAFPLMSLGTLLLGGGMFYCAFLVEQSTKERVFQRPADKSKDGPTIHIIQPGNQTVGDQTVDSFSFTDASRPLKKYTTSWKVHQETKLGVWLATGTTMSGFVLQFIGLRAMHSAVSVFQLGAILLMSIIRAGLRTQRLGKEQNLLHDRPDEVEGHELDWLALQMAKEPEKKDQGRKFWSVVASPARLSSPLDNRAPKPNTHSRRAYFYRSRLAELTSQPTRVKSSASTAWDERQVHVRQQAQQLKKAIEASAEVLFAHAKVKSDWKAAESIPWTIDVAEYNQSASPTPQEASEIYLSLHRRKDSKQSMTWEVSQQYLEAVVGLWAWSIISDPCTEEVDKFKLRVSTASEVPTSRIMAVGVAQEDIEHARTELNLWTEDIPTLTSTKWTAIPDRIERGPHTLWEAQDEETICKITATPTSLSSNQSRLRLFGWQPAELPDSPPSPTEVFALTTTVSQSISATCAQDIYQSFLCAITVEFDFTGEQIKPLQKSRGFYFENEVVSRLAECFKESGLGSTQDAYSVIIPALRCRSKLPLPGVALPAVYSVAENRRKEGNFQEAEAILKWAWQTTLEIPDGQDNGALGATMLELGELYRHALFWKDGSQKEFGLNGISWMEKETKKPLHNDSVAIISGRYADLAHRTADHSRPKPNAHDVIVAISRDDRTENLWLISQVDEILPADRDGRTVLSWAAQRGWPEIVKAALEISAIDSGDKLERTPLSYAAEHGHADIVGILMKHGALPISEDSSRRTPLSYAAAEGCVPVMDFLLNDRRVTTFTKDKNLRSPLHWAAGNGQEGAIEWLLQHGAEEMLHNPDKQDHTPLIVALLNCQTPTAEFLVKKGAKFDILIEQIEAWRWAVKNGEWTCAAFLLRHSNQESTERKAVVLRVLPYPSRHPEGSVSQDATPESEIAVHAFADNGTRTVITVETVRDVAAGQCKVAAELCEQRDGSLARGKLELNGDVDLKIIGLLLDQLGKKAKITEEVVQAAAGNVVSGAAVMKLLLDRGGSEVKVTEGVVQAAAGNDYSGEEVMKLLLDERGPEVKVTEGVIQAAVGNQRSGAAVMKLLLDERGLEVKVTEGVVQAAAGNNYSGEEVMKLLLDERGSEVKVTGTVVQAAAGNNYSGKEVMKLLLDERGPEVKITEEVVQAAAGNNCSGEEVMKLLLDERGSEVKVTGTVVQAAAGNNYSGKEVMKLLLDERGPEVKITEEVVQAAAGNNYSGEEVMKLLLDKRGLEVKVTEEVIQAAAGNRVEVMKLLLDERGPEVKITEGVVQAAAGNWVEVMKLLLDERGPEVKVTEGVVQAAAGNRVEMIKLLLDERGPEVKITEGVVQAAAGNRVEVMKLLLDKRGPEVKVTEGVVQAAAGNRVEVMKLLLDERGPEVKITEGVVQAAAGNRVEVMKLLLEKRGLEVKVTEGVVQAAAGNRVEVMKLLLDERGSEVKITKGVFQAAAGNDYFGKAMMKLLLDRRGSEVEVIQAAARGIEAHA